MSHIRKKHRRMAYLVYRRYSDEELKERRRSGEILRDRNRFFGWTDNKHTIKLFSLQRSSKKYFIRQVTLEELSNIGTERTMENFQLELISLQSNRLKRSVALMTTADERDTFERKIRRMFTEACSLGPWITEGDVVNFTRMVNCIANLIPKYAGALAYLGYVNTDLNSVFDSVDDEEWIDLYRPGGNSLNTGKLIIYSLESVIKVILDDM